MTKNFKIPESVLVVIYTPTWDVLLIRRADGMGGAQDFWQSVTGSKDFADEPLIDTAVREVWEETGIDCASGAAYGDRLQDWHLENVYSIYPRWLHRYAPGVTHNREHLFGLQVDPGCTVRLNPREHTHYQWLPYRQAAERCFSPSNAEAILLLDRFAQPSPRLGASHGHSEP
ncbi:MAG: dihydroneopterin triphosphate diphosphatase [Rhodoferax sp.]|nr:dihydroneopterin triphosphate diphosphatase [Rhodoferax sp.]